MGNALMRKMMKICLLKFTVRITSLQKRQCHPCQNGFINLLLPVGVATLIVAAQKQMRLY